VQSFLIVWHCPREVEEDVNLLFYIRQRIFQVKSWKLSKHTSSGYVVDVLVQIVFSSANRKGESFKSTLKRDTNPTLFLLAFLSLQQQQQQLTVAFWTNAFGLWNGQIVVTSVGHVGWRESSWLTMSDLGNNQLELILFLWTRTFLFIFNRIIRERRKKILYFFYFFYFFQLWMEEVPEKSRWQRCGPPPRPTKLLLTHPFLLLLSAGFSVLSHWPLKEDVGFFRSPRVLRVLISCPVCCSRSPAVHTNTCPFSTDDHCRKWLVCEYFHYKLFFFPTSFIRRHCFTSRD
jgi:hypothetical protein